MFMLVTLISLIFLTAYISINQQKDATRFFVSQIELRRYKRALFGRLADSKAGEFMSCGGFIETPDMDCAAGPSQVYKYISSKRCCTGKLGGSGFRVHPNKHHYYYYDRSGYWSGYRGKRYLYPLPSDDWNEKTLAKLTDDFGESITFYSHCTFNCFLSTTNDCMFFDSTGRTVIHLKDYVGYSEDEIRLIIPLSYFECRLHTVDSSNTDYTAHKFEIMLVDLDREMASVGLKNVLIQTKEGGTWVTKFTTGIAIPPLSKCLQEGYNQEINTMPALSLTINKHNMNLK